MINGGQKTIGALLLAGAFGLGSWGLKTASDSAQRLSVLEATNRLQFGELEKRLARIEEQNERLLDALDAEKPRRTRR